MISARRWIHWTWKLSSVQYLDQKAIRRFRPALFRCLGAMVGLAIGLWFKENSRHGFRCMTADVAQAEAKNSGSKSTGCMPSYVLCYGRNSVEIGRASCRDSG